MTDQPVLRASTLVFTLFTVVALAFVFVLQASAQTESVLYTFTGKKDGGNPYGSLLRDAAGNLYGTTLNYGSDCITNVCGVVFKISATGHQTVVYSFDSQATGRGPLGSLASDSAGNLYGMTVAGGNLSCANSFGLGCGTVFRIDPSGTESVLHAFTNGPDGDQPQAGLLTDRAGNLYGTTFRGGANNSGTVFKLDATGRETRLHSFTGTTDGSWPTGILVRDKQGRLYGTTELGGDMSGCSGFGCGVVFKISAAGQETVLYSFTGGADGSEPGANLQLDSSGNLYGVTGLGGDLTCNAPYGCGVVFKVDSHGSETVLYTFSSETGDGWDPIDGVVRDSAGNLFGTTYRGGAYGLGTIFKVDTGGNQTVLHSFTGGPDGSYPEGNLIIDSSGRLYGTAASGGQAHGCFTTGGIGCGVVFRLTP